MKNVTIVLAVMAMLAVSAHGALVEENFNQAPVGWVLSSPGASTFDWNGATAVDGQWVTHGTNDDRYYTTFGSTLTEASTFTFRCDITAVAMTGSWARALVGLSNTTTNNKSNSLCIALVNNGSSFYSTVQLLDGSGGGVEQWAFVHVPGQVVAGTVYHFELRYDGVTGAADVYAWTGATPPPTPTATLNTVGAWSVDAFGTYNTYDDNLGGTEDAVIDNLYLVPEPATMVLLGLGGIGVLLRRKRR